MLSYLILRHWGPLTNCILLNRINQYLYNETCLLEQQVHLKLYLYIYVNVLIRILTEISLEIHYSTFYVSQKLLLRRSLICIILLIIHNLFFSLIKNVDHVIPVSPCLRKFYLEKPQNYS